MDKHTNIKHMYSSTLQQPQEDLKFILKYERSVKIRVRQVLPVDTLENTSCLSYCVFLVLSKPVLYLKIVLSILFVLYYNIYFTLKIAI